ncbi:hypothetical protein LZK98_04800 [Sphingomonas cannabina]|uniref:hypothetical protein n=1 Tax=Sphingomonas cannabina TaxID=2899123 RepID=UPI001F32E00A|nr:hypothetical protein [Sphingomonas cannabina]UIJ46269.1 hypothetical protein LZK98_04800 [Sphingomonas cannabina]
MKRHLIVNAIMLAPAVFAFVPAQAQYVMDWNAGNALVMSSIQNDSLNRERARADRARQQNGQPNRRSTATPTSTRSIIDRTYDAAIAAIAPEFQRRTTAYGKPAAARWLNIAARELGRQMGAMAPEYQRRLRTNGTWNADQWFLDQARLAGQQYVRNGASR